MGTGSFKVWYEKANQLPLKTNVAEYKEFGLWNQTNLGFYPGSISNQLHGLDRVTEPLWAWGIWAVEMVRVYSLALFPVRDSLCQAR